MNREAEKELVEPAWQELAIQLELNSEHCGWFKTWLGDMLDNYARGMYTAALAASAAKVDATKACDHVRQGDQVLVMLCHQCANDLNDAKALTAKLQASEQQAQELQGHYDVALCAWHDEIKRREASERALERAKAFVNLKIAHRGDCVFVRQDFTGAECTCGKQAVALASPEARATGETHD